MVRILFVDDEPNILQGLQRMLRPMRNIWRMDFAGGGPAALSALREADFDVIVTDMRMPGMNGAELIQEMAKDYSALSYIVLSGQTDPEHLELLAQIPHERLTKPCLPDQLKEAVERSFRASPQSGRRKETNE